MNADVVLAAGLALESTIGASLASKPLVLKVVGDLAWERAVASGWTCADFDSFQQSREGIRAGCLKTARNWAVRRAAAVIVPSRYLAERITAWGVPAHRVRVICNAVRLPDSLPHPSIDLPAATNAITVGRLVAWKRVGDVIRCVAQMNGLGLVVVGDGPERSRLEALAQRLGVESRVRFTGLASHAETLALMRAADFLILNSTYEGFPHVLVEATLLGLPIVCADAGGSREVIRDGETGVLVDPHEFSSLCTAVRALAADPRRRNDFRKNAEREATRFDVARMVSETEAVLFTACNGRSRSVC